MRYRAFPGFEIPTFAGTPPRASTRAIRRQILEAQGGQKSAGSPPDLAAEIREALRASPPRDVPAWRVLRRGWSKALASSPPNEVHALALELIDAPRGAGSPPTSSSRATPGRSPRSRRRRSASWAGVSPIGRASTPSPGEARWRAGDMMSACEPSRR